MLHISFSHASLLQASFSSVIFASKKYKHLAASYANIKTYTDASGRTTDTEMLPEALGLFIPNIAWLFFEWPGEPSHIANLELLAAILGFLFALFVRPKSTHCHLYIDNTNAITWTLRKIKSNNFFSRNLVSLNALSQGVYKDCCQTREYIKSKDNMIADAISRHQFNLPQLVGIPRFQLAPEAINCLIQLSLPSESQPLVTVLGRHIMSDLDSSPLFLPHAT